MAKILRYLFIFTILTLPLNASNIENVIINGNKRVSDETVKIYGEINSFNNYSEKNANQILKNLYGTGFFENVEIKFEENNLIVNLKEFPVINQLLILGEKSKKFENVVKT